MAKTPDAKTPDANSPDTKDGPEPSAPWQEMEDLFLRTLEQPREERESFLDQTCHDPALRRLIDSMLRADERAAGFLESPMVPWAPQEQTGFSPDVPAEGQRIGHYQLGRLIGVGGMGHVYLARPLEADLQRPVVIKLARQDLAGEHFAHRLRAERRILSGLNHPAIARLYDGGSHQDQPFFVMEYVDGDPVDTFCDRRRLSLDERLVLFREICGAVRYAHQKLVVHRDLKPSNILVTADGQPKLLDFGIAKILDTESVLPASDLTASMLRPLTPGYASPEQFLGQRVTVSSDVYSLGVLLYKLLSGHLPFDFSGRTFQEIEQIVHAQDPVRPSLRVIDDLALARIRRTRPPALRRKLFGDLDSIVLKALRKTPQDRYGSAEELSEDLRRYLEGLPTRAHRGSWQYRSRKFVRRHRFGLAVATLLTLLVTTFTTVTWMQSVHLARERDENKQVVALIKSIFQAADPYEKGDDGSELTVRAALELSEDGIRRQLADQPKLRGTLLTILGRIHLSLGAPQAPALLREAWQLRRELRGDADPATAQTLSHLALALANQGEATGRDKAYEALAILRQSSPQDPALRLEALNNLVTVLCNERATEDAAPLSLEALELAESVPEVSRVDLFFALHNRAIVLGRQGDSSGAQALLQRALREQEESLGPNHPWVGETLNTLAVGLYRSKDYDRALDLNQRATDIRRQHLGEAHPVLANSHNTIGDLQRQKGDLDGAARAYRQASEILAQSMPTNLHRLRIETKLAELHLERGQPDKADQHLRQILPTWTTHYPEGHWVLSQAQSVHGESLVRLERYDEAEPLLLQSLEFFDGMAYTRGVRETLWKLVKLYEAWKKPSEADHFKIRLESLEKS